MEALVHLDPERCLCVLGPQVSAQYLVATGLDPTAIPAVMSHRGLAEAGIRRLMEVESFETAEAKQRKETLLRSAYELDPAFPAFKVTEKLRELGQYEQWLTEAFAPVTSRSAMLGFNATLEHLTSLQRQGLLLAYSHYDPVLLNTQRFKPVLMDSEEGVREWVTSASGRSTSGLLYVHGSLDVPSSIKWDSVAYSREVGDSPGGRALKEACKTRCVIFFGFDADFLDPLLQKFCTTFLPTPVQTPPLLLSTQPGHQPFLPSVLTVRVGQLALEKVLLPVPTSQQGNPAHLYRAKDKQKCIHVTLLYSDNSSGLNSADKIKSMSSVGATQITLTQDSKHHLLTLHLDSSGMESLWKVVCGSAGSGIHAGLLAVRLEGGVTVWLSSQNSKGEGADRQAAQNQEKSGTAHLPAVPTLPLHSSPHAHNSTVSVISSVWTSPIPSPSVTKMGSTPSPSTRPTLPSPLMNTTKRSPLRGTSANFELFRNLPVNTTLFPSQMHQQMRRIRSEQDRLTYFDRINSEEEKRKRNGILIHQESAPAIIVNDATRTLSVPSPSTLSNIQSSANEHRIECIDQLQNPPSTIPSTGVSGTTGGKLKSDFPKIRQQFINDAIEWSKKLSLTSQQQKRQKIKPEMTFEPPASVSTVGMSMEDQEKLLSQHFEQMQRQQQSVVQLTSQYTPSFVHSSTLAPSKLPFGTQPVSSPQPSLSPSRPRSKSPKPSPLQLPSSTTTLNSVLNTGGLYGFMPTTSALQGLQSPSANLLFNPASHAQYAALLNQYIQMMSSQSVAGNKSQPLVISDPSVLQSLQQAIVLLPDGTFAPANLNLDSVLKKDPTQQQQQQQMSPIKTPGSGGKRAQSPNSEMSRLGPPPKRRRSSSLPDITQIQSVVEKNSPIQEDKEAEEETEDEQDSKEDMRKRNMPPLSMIQIPKDVKMHDPMLGFPTPPQSSPHFSSSPLIPTVVSTMFQPHPMTPITPCQDSFNHEDIKELVGESSVQTPVPSSPNGAGGLPPFPTGRGPIQLWQFLLDLLISPDKNHLIHWTGNGYEFRILLPEEIAKLWGARKNKPRMNYDKLSRGLRYYYSKGIMDKVPGKKLTFKYTCDVPNYLQSRGAAAVRVLGTNSKTSVSTEA